MIDNSNYNTLINDAIAKNKLNFSDINGILITGATGLIGASVVDMLVKINEKQTKKFNIYIAARNIEKVKSVFKDYIEKGYFKYISYDATKLVQFGDIKIDYIIQGASNASPDLYVKQPVETLLGNVIGIKNILEYAKVNKLKKVIYISSSEVYGNDKNRDKLIEEDDYGKVDILEARSSYMLGKRAAENLCIGYLKEYGVNTVIIRPGHIYGPHISPTDMRASSEFLRDASKNKKIIMNSPGKQLRSYCHAVDCASAIIYLLCNGKNGEAYNVSNKDSIVTIREFAERVSKLAQVEFKVGTDTNVAIAYSALNAKKLENLGWHAVVDLDVGINEVLKDLGQH